MKESDAKQVIEQAFNQAFLKGVFSLQDAAILVKALEVLFPAPSQEVIEPTKEDSVFKN